MAPYERPPRPYCLSPITCADSHCLPCTARAHTLVVCTHAMHTPPARPHAQHQCTTHKSCCTATPYAWPSCPYQRPRAALAKGKLHAVHNTRPHIRRHRPAYSRVRCAHTHTPVRTARSRPSKPPSAAHHRTLQHSTEHCRNYMCTPMEHNCTIRRPRSRHAHHHLPAQFTAVAPTSALP